jgi:hypothetical protein
VRFLCRNIFTPEGGEKIIIKSHPAILHSEWRSQSGKAIVVMCNYTLDNQSIEYYSASGFKLPSELPKGFSGSAKHFKGMMPARSCLAVSLQ